MGYTDIPGIPDPRHPRHPRRTTTTRKSVRWCYPQKATNRKPPSYSNLTKQSARAGQIYAVDLFGYLSIDGSIHRVRYVFD